MKQFLIAAVFLALAGCAGKEHVSTVSDSDSSGFSANDATPVEDVSTPEVTPAEPEKVPVELSADELDSLSFFGVRVSAYVLAGNDGEKEAWNDLLQTFGQLEAMTLDSVKRWYTTQNTEEAADEGGPAETSTTIRNEKETWYYDAAGKLRVYTDVFRQTNDVHGFQNTNKIYVYEGDSIVAAYEHMISGGEGDIMYRTRLNLKSWPNCGMTIYKSYGESVYKASPVRGQIGLNSFVFTVGRSRKRVASELRAGFARAKLNDGSSMYTMTASVTEDYPYKYEANLQIGTELYEKLFPRM